MSYIYYVFLLAFICFSGSFMSVIAGFGGIIMIFYLCFKWGPKLGMIALPVSICFFLCVWLDDFARMYAKHVLISVPIFLVVAVVFCHFYYYEEDYKKIVIAVTAGFTAITMILLATWM